MLCHRVTLSKIEMKTNDVNSASCAAHGLDKIRPKLGSTVLMFGAGPTGASF